MENAGQASSVKKLFTNWFCCQAFLTKHLRVVGILNKFLVSMLSWPWYWYWYWLRPSPAVEVPLLGALEAAVRALERFGCFFVLGEPQGTKSKQIISSSMEFNYCKRTF